MLGIFSVLATTLARLVIRTGSINVLCVCLEHGALFIEKHLVELGVDRRVDAHLLSDEFTQFLEVIGPFVSANSELLRIKFPSFSD